MSSPLDTIRQWFELVTGLVVIYEDDPEPAAPRPDESTYITIGWTTDDSPMATPYEHTSDEDDGASGVKTYRSLVREAQLGVEIFGPGAMDFGRAIELSVGRPDVLDLFLADPLVPSVQKTGQITDQPVLRSTTREPDATLTFTVGWTDSEVIETTPVETFEIDTSGVTP
jgi:hypothetical protein